MFVVEADLAVGARVPRQQLHRDHHRPVSSVVAPEIQRRQQCWQHPAVVVGVRTAQHGADPRLEHLIVGLRLLDQLPQHLLPDHRIQGLAHNVIRVVHGRFGKAEQDVLLATHAAQVLGQLLLHPPIRPRPPATPPACPRRCGKTPGTRTHRVPAPGGTRSCVQTSGTHSGTRDRLSPAPPYTPPRQRAAPLAGQETGPRSRRTSATDRTRDESHQSCSPPAASHPRPASTTRSNPRSTTPDARPATVAESTCTRSYFAARDSFRIPGP